MRYLLLIFCFVLYSCDTVNVEPVMGDCSRPIELSKREFSFNVSGGTESATVSPASSRFYGTTRYEYGYEVCELFSASDNPDYCNSNYCKHNWVMKIKCSWFSLTRIDENTLIVSVNRNETGEKREHIVDLQAGNCFSGFLITQSAE